jgi:hypothetical protein
VTVGNCREASNKAANSVQEAARLFSRSLHNPGETCVPFDPISARTGCDGVEPRAGYDPEQEDEDKCEKHERIHRALLALLTNLPERGATNFSVAPDVPSKLLVVVALCCSTVAASLGTAVAVAVARRPAMSATWERSEEMGPC